MFLKSIDIFGFKSFANKTHIDFNEGITALLGQNGMGKSNIVDAVKWVLAENRSKQLRAEKKEDVIFNGTQRRPALNVAEVTLTMSNEKGLLPLKENEIAIKRRLYRSGENQYFINNKVAGAREISRIFMNTGIGKSAYSVMEQGRIDQVLSSKPEDRRYLFEEAAGIAGSKEECREAEAMLFQSRENLEQIERVLGEIKKNYDSLQEQSIKATEYRAIKDGIFLLEKNIALLRLRGYISEKEKVLEEQKKTEEKYNALKMTIDNIHSLIDKSMNTLKKLQEDVYKRQGELIKLQAQKNGKLELVTQFNNSLSQIKEKIETLNIRKENINSKIEDINSQIDESAADNYVKEKQLKEVTSNIEGYQKNIDATLMQRTNNEKLADDKRKEIVKLEDERRRLQKELNTVTVDIAKTLDEKLKEHDFNPESLQEAKSALFYAINALKIYVKGRKEILNDFLVSKNSGEDAGERYKEELQNIGSVYDNFNTLIGKVDTALNEYIKTSPEFIGELLGVNSVIGEKRSIEHKIQDNIEAVNKVNVEIKELGEVNTTLTKKVSEYKDTLAKLNVNKATMQTALQFTQQSIRKLKTDLAGERANYESIESELFTESKRQKETIEQVESIQGELEEIEDKGIKLAEELKEVDKEIAEHNKAIADKREELLKREEERIKIQEAIEKYNLSLNSLNNQIENVRNNFQELYSRSLEEYKEDVIEESSITIIKEKLAEERSKLSKLGQVNLMAIEEFKEVKERYERQKQNYLDAKESMENLKRVSEEIKAKAGKMFIDTYNTIKKNFYIMFRKLFNGGRAELKLEDPNDVLTSGIQILAQPPGKTLESISLLSGGERTMTAVALLFATYQVRASPFCLLDEIDAALDDKNVASFVNMLMSFSNVSQYIVITHNKKTALCASSMFGVSMQEEGVSDIVSIKFSDYIRSEEIGKERGESESSSEEIEKILEDEKFSIPERPEKRVYNEDGSITDRLLNKTIKVYDV